MNADLGATRSLQPFRRRVLAALACAALTAGLPGAARAQPRSNGLESASLALAAYEASKARCVYSDALAKALADLDASLARAHGDLWTRMRAEGPGFMPLLRNIGRMMGTRSECESFGKGVGGAQAVYRETGGTDRQVLAELKTLADGGGRSPSEEMVTRPPPPLLSLETSDPGPAAATARALSRQFPDMNKSVELEGPGTTLRRLPQDGGPDRASPSRPPLSPSVQPPAAQPSETARAGIATVPSQQAQGTPQPPPPAVAAPALPSASPAPVPPGGPVTPSATAARPEACRVGAVCRLPEPTFACTSAEAQRLAAAGPVQGRQAGLAAARAGACEIVAAGRPLLFEATQTPGVVYATESGKHVGYLPLGVSAPAGSGAGKPCARAGFCAVRPGPPIWVCPGKDGLDLPTPDEKLAARCVPLTAGQVGLVEAPGTVPLQIRLGGDAPEQRLNYAAWADLVGLDVPETATPTARGWCRPGDWCVTAKTALLCIERAAYERVMGAPAGEERRKALLTARGCHIVLRSNPLKPASTPTADDPWRLVEVEHPVFKKGWASAEALTEISFGTPVRYTASLSDIVVGADRTPSFAAVMLRAQGTAEAVGEFRTGARERLQFCRANEGAENADPLSACLGRPNGTLDARADCRALRVTVDGERYRLAERPDDVAADFHVDLHRRWLFQNLATAEWLDGSAQSGELTVRTAFDALCPGTNPEASVGVAYRDPRARYPRELQGRWYDDRRACADPRRDDPDYDDHAYMQITAEAVLGRGSEDRLNAIRQVGRAAWAIDESGKSHEETENFSTATYTLTRDGFALTADGHRTEWVRCR